MAYYSTHPMQDAVDRSEWAYTRQIIMHSTGKWKPIKAEDLILTFGKKQTQADIDFNLKNLKLALKARK